MTAEQTPEDGMRWTKGEGPTNLRFNAGTAWPIINDSTGRWEALANGEETADRIIADHGAAAALAVAREGLEFYANEANWIARYDGYDKGYVVPAVDEGALARDTLRRIDEANAASGAKPSPGTAPAEGST